MAAPLHTLFFTVGRSPLFVVLAHFLVPPVFPCYKIERPPILPFLATFPPSPFRAPLFPPNLLNVY